MPRLVTKGGGGDRVLADYFTHAMWWLQKQVRKLFGIPLTKRGPSPSTQVAFWLPGRIGRGGSNTPCSFCWFLWEQELQAPSADCKKSGYPKPTVGRNPLGGHTEKERDTLTAKCVGPWLSLFSQGARSRMKNFQGAHLTAITWETSSPQIPEPNK